MVTHHFTHTKCHHTVSYSSVLINFPLTSCFLQEGAEPGQTGGGTEGTEGVTDVIQQLLELSEQVTSDSTQAPPPGPTIAMETAINQDILQVSQALRQRIRNR